jgi:RNA polymerase sigma-70 factor (ECF subfamily)
VSVDPEHEVLLADAVGLALQIVLDTLPPAQRVAFVLHDMFEVSFEDIGAMVGRTPVAARQLAARARRRVREASVPDPDLEEQRRVVAAFFAATTSGDFEALLGLLHPDVVLRSDGGEQRKMSFVRRGVEEVARGALAGVLQHAELQPVWVNGAAGMLVLTNGKPVVVMAFTVAQGKIVEIDAVLGRERLAQLIRLS